MSGRVAADETTSNGITVRVPRKLLPYAAVFLLGGGGGVASRFWGMDLEKAAAATPVSADVAKQLAAQTTQIAVLETRLAGVEAALRDLKTEVAALRDLRAR